MVGGVAVHTSAYSYCTKYKKSAVMEGTAILANYFPND